MLVYNNRETKIGKQNKSNCISELKVGENVITDHNLIAEHFNTHFINIGVYPDENDTLNEYGENLDFSDTNIHSQTNNKFNFSLIKVGSVLCNLKNLKANKSTGLDAIPAKILKLAAHIIAPSLMYIFNLSLQSGIYVNDWKRARVTPIFKSEDKSKSENYRPNSILSIVSKVFEKEVFRQMYTYVNESNLLSKYQSGFRPQLSILSALIKICDEILNNMDEGKINCIVFLDIRKAFDSINHNILLSKMRSNFGISGNELLWFESYLTNREQQCVANGILSSVGKLRCGVPQGSILGPLSFLLYINDLPQCLQKTTPGLYADDTEIYASSHNVNDLINNINYDLNIVTQWMENNKLQIHPEKSKCMFIASSSKIKNIPQG